MPITPPANGLQTKVVWVFKNSGNFLSNEDKNIYFYEKMAAKIWVKNAYPPLKNHISEQNTVDFAFVSGCCWQMGFLLILYLHKRKLFGQWFEISLIKRNQRTKTIKTFYSVSLRKFFSQKVDFLGCSLERKFPEISKTLPTFVCSP